MNLQISKYVDYCMGFGYLNKRKYADDLVQERRIETDFQAGIERMMRAAQQKELDRPLPYGNERPQQMPAFLQQGLQMLMTVPRMVMNFFQPVFQPLRQMIGQALQMPKNAFEQAVGRVLSFFFGGKKDRTEEKDKREKDDFAQTDLFTKPEVQAPSGAGQGGKR